MVIRRFKIQGKYYNVYPSNRKGKKYKIYKAGKAIHFGASGYTIALGTKRGDSYCARSFGIKSRGAFSPNALSRKMWKCIGKKSSRKK